MAQRCEICGKGPQFGNRVSHAHNVTHRRFNPNLQSIRTTDGKGTHRRVRVCTRCLQVGEGDEARPGWPRPKAGRRSVSLRAGPASRRRVVRGDHVDLDAHAARQGRRLEGGAGRRSVWPR